MSVTLGNHFLERELGRALLFDSLGGLGFLGGNSSFLRLASHFYFYFILFYFFFFMKK